MNTNITQAEVVEAVVKWLKDVKKLHVQPEDLTHLVAEQPDDHAFTFEYKPEHQNDSR